MSGYALGEPYGFGGSFQQTVRGADPVAGAIFSQQLEGDFRSRLLSAVFTLTTDGNAADRYVTVEYDEADGNPSCVNGAAVVVTANSTQRFVGSATRGVAEWAANTDVFFPIEPLFLEGGVVLKIAVANIQATDTLTAIRFVFDRYPTAASEAEALAGDT